MKTPFNWVGNKYNYMNQINEIVKYKHYNNVIDMFMGSGNISLNINCDYNNIIANDKTKLLPILYKTIKECDKSFSMDDLENIINEWNRFSDKQDYYEFRKHWNIKYISDIFDDNFIIETALLLKMCSNSMVRFNKSGEFNQGFRGLGSKTEFFADSMKQLVINGLTDLQFELNSRDIQFIVGDALDLKYNEDDLLIIDPPYILRQDMYTLDFTETHDLKLIDIIKHQPVDFIYFNYIERDNIIHSELHDVLISDNTLRVIELSNSTKSGQGAKSTKNIKEVLITNIK